MSSCILPPPPPGGLAPYDRALAAEAATMRLGQALRELRAAREHAAEGQLDHDARVACALAEDAVLAAVAAVEASVAPVDDDEEPVPSTRDTLRSPSPSRSEVRP